MRELTFEETGQVNGGLNPGVLPLSAIYFADAHGKKVRAEAAAASGAAGGAAAAAKSSTSGCTIFQLG